MFFHFDLTENEQKLFFSLFYIATLMQQSGTETVCYTYLDDTIYKLHKKNKFGAWITYSYKNSKLTSFEVYFS
jgi:hypothetical protein